MSRATPATRRLDALGAPYRLHVYDYDPEAPNIGQHAARTLGISPSVMFKSLMTLVDGRPVCAVVGSDGELALKRLAQAAGGKSAQMMAPQAAERSTGYKVGGISPLGQRRVVPVFLDAGALDHAAIYVNGGQRGLQIEIAPAELVRAAGAIVAPLR